MGTSPRGMRSAGALYGRLGCRAAARIFARGMAGPGSERMGRGVARGAPRRLRAWLPDAYGACVPHANRIGAIVHGLRRKSLIPAVALRGTFDSELLRRRTEAHGQMAFGGPAWPCPDAGGSPGSDAWRHDA